jgi:hypothetical protein
MSVIHNGETKNFGFFIRWQAGPDPVTSAGSADCYREYGGYICTGPCNPVRKIFIFQDLFRPDIEKIPDLIPGSIWAPIMSGTGKRSQIYAPI